MGVKQQLAELDNLARNLTKALDKEREANAVLREMCYRHESQLARKLLDESESENFREIFSNLIYNDNRETAISVFSLEKIAETPLDFFTSKRLESQIFNYAPVGLFIDNITVPGENKKQPCPIVLPFVPEAPALDCYGEFPVVRPYSPAGLNGEDATAFALSPRNPFKSRIVNKDIIIFSDYFEYHQTNGNTSLTIREAVRIYADLIAECENAKRQNRNWIKIPLIFGLDGIEDGKEVNKLITEVNSIVAGVKGSQDALVTKYAKNLLILNTRVQYYGTELENSIKDYQNKLWNFLGIGHIFNENRAQKVTAEFEKTEDEYNINIIKRLQLREKGLSRAKKIFPEFFSKATWRVNLSGFSPAYAQDAIDAEENQDTEGADNDN